MCRLLAYLGPPVSLERLLLQPPHSLLHQSWAPRRQRHGTINADGWGVGWYDLARRSEPARHRTPRPMWADRSFASWAGLVDAPAVLAAVRSATPPAPVEESGTPPFTSGRWLFAHNGAVDGFRTEVGARLRRLVSDRRTAGIEGASDSEVLFALALDNLDQGASKGDALCEVVRTVLELTSARLNLVLTDGSCVAATACGDSLSVLSGTGLAERGFLLASEPFDDEPGWQVVADGSLVTASAHDLWVTALRPPAATFP
ncbi:MAG: ergothioneine biosynthesis protein EgtC [Actinomycetota bacterium]|nr:ergothioneine biosynthesis protein EgtC [Actinomycetota bacterium]